MSYKLVRRGSSFSAIEERNHRIHWKKQFNREQHIRDERDFKTAMRRKTVHVRRPIELKVESMDMEGLQAQQKEMLRAEDAKYSMGELKKRAQALARNIRENQASSQKQVEHFERTGYHFNFESDTEGIRAMIPLQTKLKELKELSPDDPNYEADKALYEKMIGELHVRTGKIERALGGEEYRIQEAKAKYAKEHPGEEMPERLIEEARMTGGMRSIKRHTTEKAVYEQTGLNTILEGDTELEDEVAFDEKTMKPVNEFEQRMKAYVPDYVMPEDVKEKILSGEIQRRHDLALLFTEHDASFDTLKAPYSGQLGDPAFKRFYFYGLKPNDDRFNQTFMEVLNENPEIFIEQCLKRIENINTEWCKATTPMEAMQELSLHGDELALGFVFNDILLAAKKIGVDIPPERMSVLTEKALMAESAYGYYGICAKAYSDPTALYAPPEAFTYDQAYALTGNPEGGFEGMERVEWVNRAFNLARMSEAPGVHMEKLTIIEGLKEMGLGDNNQLIGYMSLQGGKYKETPYGNIPSYALDGKLCMTSPDWEKAKIVSYNKETKKMDIQEIDKTPEILEHESQLQVHDILTNPDKLQAFTQQIHALATGVRSTDHWLMVTNTDKFRDMRDSLYALDKTLQNISKQKESMDLNAVTASLKDLSEKATIYSEYKKPDNEAKVAAGKKLSNRAKNRPLLADMISKVAKGDQKVTIPREMTAELVGTMVKDINVFVQVKGPQEAVNTGADVAVEQGIRFVSKAPDLMQKSDLTSQDLHQTQVSMQKMQQVKEQEGLQQQGPDLEKDQQVPVAKDPDIQAPTSGGLPGLFG